MHIGETKVFQVKPLLEKQNRPAILGLESFVVSNPGAHEIKYISKPGLITK